ncbi:MAG: DUF6636 domain-containing protein [Actinomycetota bacterium]
MSIARRCTIGVLALVAAVAVAGCGSDDVDTAAAVRPGSTDGATAADAGDATTDATTGTTATTAPADSGGPIGSSTAAGTSPTSSTAASTAPTSSASTSTTEIVTTTSTTVDPVAVDIVDGSYAFTSPSGNISCQMVSAFGVSCHIADKQWTVDQPAGCEFDWGNAVGVGTDGAFWECYSDVFWNPDAPALDYGRRAIIGDYVCESEITGVTCSNSRGDGFSLARANAAIFAA